MISFLVPGVPKPQPRARAFAFRGKARVYTPGSAEEWKSQVALAAQAHLPREPLEGPLSVSLSFWLPRPKSHYKKRGLRPNAPAYVESKPDLDNLIKAITDCMTTLGFWRDDAQLVEVFASKHYETDAIRPGCLVGIRNKHLQLTVEETRK